VFAFKYSKKLSKEWLKKKKEKRRESQNRYPTPSVKREAEGKNQEGGAIEPKETRI